MVLSGAGVIRLKRHERHAKLLLKVIGGEGAWKPICALRTLTHAFKKKNTL